MHKFPDFFVAMHQDTDTGSRLVQKCDESQIRESLELIFKLRLHGNRQPSGRIYSGWCVGVNFGSSRTSLNTPRSPEIV